MKKVVHDNNSLWRTLVFSFTLIAALTLSQALAQVASYSEAPQLASRVAEGELPQVEERLPDNPLIVPVVERIGQYGGAWRSALVGGGGTGRLITTFAYDNLVRWDPEWTEVIPNIAESFESNEDATEFTFYLRSGMKWSDGEPFTADDILFWYEDIAMNQQLSPAGPPSWMRVNVEGVRTPGVVEKLDDYTVRFSFPAPNGLFLQELATPEGGIPTIYPRHYLEQFHQTYNPEGINQLIQEAGVSDWVQLFNNRSGFWDGRFTNTDLPMLLAWTPIRGYGDGAQMIVERNPYYWKVDAEGNQLPYLDRIVYNLVQDPEVFLLNALSGEVDLVTFLDEITTLNNKSLFIDNAERGDYRLYDIVPAFTNTAVISLNWTHEDPVKREIFQNKDFRIGLSHAINREEINNLIYVGQTEPWQAAPRRDSELYNERLAKQYTDYDVDLANQHLDLAGYSERDAAGFRLGPDGNRISFTVDISGAVRPAWSDIMELVQGYWREVGIDAQVRNIDRSLLYTRKEANQHDAVVWGGDGGLGDVILDPSRYFPQSSESNYAILWAYWYMGDPRGEEPPAEVKRQMDLYDQLQSTGDLDEQAELMRQILEIAADQFYTIGIVKDPLSYGIVKNNFRNVPESMIGAWLYPGPAPTNPEQYFIEGTTTSTQ